MNALCQRMPIAASVSVALLPVPPVAAGRRPVDVEDLLEWTYRRQKAHLVIGTGRGLAVQEAEMDGVELHDGSNLSAVERVLRLGCIIDQSAPDPGALHPDAEIVHRAVTRLDHRTHGLPLGRALIEAARFGERPDAMVGVMPRPEPMLTPKGRIHVEYADPGRRFGTCPLVWEPSATRILQAREEYAAWHRGLRLLALALQGERLTLWRVLPPAAPARPWEEARTNPVDLRTKT